MLINLPRGRFLFATRPFARINLFMNRVKQFIREHQFFIPSVALLLCTLIMFSVSFIVLQRDKSKQTQSVVAATIHITRTPTVLPAPTIQPTAFFATSTAVNQTPTPVIQLIATPTSTVPQPTQHSVQSATAQQQSQPNNNPQTQPSPMQTESPTSVPATPLPTAAMQQTVSLHITDPDGTSSFPVTLHSNDNLCDNLTEAKNEGKIKSLTLDASYLSVYHSLYVREINGFNNNWTVSVNGTAPEGCSLYNPKPNDSIVWKFG